MSMKKTRRLISHCNFVNMADVRYYNKKVHGQMAAVICGPPR